MTDILERVEAEAIRQEGFVAGWEAAMEIVAKATRSLHPIEVPSLRKSNVMPRGATDLVVERILREVAPRALSPAQIIIMAQNSGSVLSESTVGRALRKLTNQVKTEQVGDSKSWRAVTTKL